MPIVDFNLGKGSQPAKKKEMLPKKQAGSYIYIYIVEDLIKLEDVMKILEKHISFGFLYVLLTSPILAKSLRWEDPSQEGCLAINDGS